MKVSDVFGKSINQVEATRENVSTLLEKNLLYPAVALNLRRCREENGWSLDQGMEYLRPQFDKGYVKENILGSLESGLLPENAHDVNSYTLFRMDVQKALMEVYGFENRTQLFLGASYPGDCGRVDFYELPGFNLRFAREARDLTIEEVTQKIGVKGLTSEFIEKYELDFKNHHDHSKEQLLFELISLYDVNYHHIYFCSVPFQR